MKVRAAGGVSRMPPARIAHNGPAAAYSYSRLLIARQCFVM